MASSPMVVISVSLSGRELKDFDRLVKHFGYESRSGAVRDALYHFIAQHRLEFEAEGTLVFTLIYDAAAGTERVHEVIHENTDLIRTSIHNHMGDRCVDVLVVTGPGERVHALLDKFTSLKDIRVNAHPL